MRRKNGFGPLRAPLESLEARTLLAAAVAQTDPVKNGPLAKVGALVPLYEEYQQYVFDHGGSGAGFTPSDPSIRMDGEAILLETYAANAISPKTLATKLNNRQMRGPHRYANGVAGYLPLYELSKVAQLGELRFARPVRAITHTGSVNSQGDAAQRADIARSNYSAFGLTGAGVEVGILSDSFDTGPGSYSADVGSGDLPSGVQVLQDSGSPVSPGTDEGRAMAQLVYDSAPGVSLSFATAFVGGQSGFAANIKALRDSGSKVIVDDVAYFEEPFFQDGVIAQAIDNVVASGSAYFSAAGNQARQSYESAFQAGVTRDSGSIGASFAGGVTHDFDSGAGVDDMQQFTLASGKTVGITLQWDQPFASVPGSTHSAANDVDIYILNSGGTSVVASSKRNNVGGDPTEYVTYTNSGATTLTLQLMIVTASGTAPAVMKYVDFYGGANFSEYKTNSSTVVGHSNSATGAGVGAAGWFNTPSNGISPPVLESYSSVGKTDILFDIAGNRLITPQVRQQPKFVAPDGGNTTFFYSDSNVDIDTLPNFFGTSAAAPAAGAVAALMLQANPALTPAQVYTALQNTALNMGVAGVDDDSGYGLIRADQAVAAVIGNASFTGQVFDDRNSNGALDAGEPTLNGVTVFADQNNNTALDGGEASTVTTGAGTYNLSLPGGVTYHLRQLPPGGYIATSPASAVQDVATLGGTVTRNFADFPIVYTGSGAGDTYELRMGVGLAGYNDDFNRASLQGASNVYTTTVTAGLGGASIVSNALQLTNGPTTTGNASGVVWTSTPFPGPAQALTANTQPLTWTFNMQQVRTNPTGQNAGAYGAAYILAANGDDWDAGGDSGYAVIIGQSGNSDPVRLVKFTSGLGSSSTPTWTTLITNGTDHPTSNYSIKVTFNPTTDQWQLFTREDTTFGTDPTTGSYSFTSALFSDTDTSLLSQTMTVLGPRWAYAGSTASQTAKFDNAKLIIGTGIAVSGNVEVLVGGVTTYTAPKSILPSLAFNLGNGDDSLNVNYTNGNPIPAGGVFFDGGSGANDAVTITGTAGADAVTIADAFLSPTAGAINLNSTSASAQTVESVVFNGGAGADSLSLSAGAYTFNSDNSINTPSLALTANAGANLLLKASQHLSGLTINNATVAMSASGSRIINTAALAITGAAKLDLSDNDLIVRTGNIGAASGGIYDGITGLIQQGLAGGTWTGNGIVTSQSQALAGRGRTTLAVALGSQASGWSGESVSGSAVLVKYTYVGDSDFDGVVDGDDFFNIDTGFGAAVLAYHSGDLDYTGSIDADDYFWIDQNYAFKGASL